MRSREEFRPMRQHANPSLLQWGVFWECIHEHMFAWVLLSVALFLLWKEYSLFWAPHGW